MMSASAQPDDIAFALVEFGKVPASDRCFASGNASEPNMHRDGKLNVATAVDVNCSVPDFVFWHMLNKRRQNPDHLFQPLSPNNTERFGSKLGKTGRSNGLIPVSVPFLPTVASVRRIAVAK